MGCTRLKKIYKTKNIGDRKKKQKYMATKQLKGATGVSINTEERQTNENCS
jgi:hypothetical protein